jgi:hypothetical protein
MIFWDQLLPPGNLAGHSRGLLSRDGASACSIAIRLEVEPVTTAAAMMAATVANRSKQCSAIATLESGDFMEKGEKQTILPLVYLFVTLDTNRPQGSLESYPGQSPSHRPKVWPSDLGSNASKPWLSVFGSLKVITTPRSRVSRAIASCPPTEAMTTLSRPQASPQLVANSRPSKGCSLPLRVGYRGNTTKVGCL